MGLINYKINAGTTITGPEGKKRLVAAMARLCEIFYTGARKSINLWAEEPMEIEYQTPTGAPVSITAKSFTEEVARDLFASGTFTTKLKIDGLQVKFGYSRAVHMDNSFEIDLTIEYKEYMVRRFLGFILDRDVIATQVFYDRAEDKVQRTKDLIYSVLRKHFGDTFFASFNKTVINRYIRDAIYVNIFGLQFTIRKKM